MNRDQSLKMELRKLFRQTKNKNDTVKWIVEQNFGYSMDSSETHYFQMLLEAHFKMTGARKKITNLEKEDLYKKQQGRCASCGEELGVDYSKIHADHIVPWKYVGDELKNNLQLLCCDCNESKSCNTNYMFLKLIGLK